MVILIADAAPLIFLAKLTLLDSLAGHVQILVPADVAKEATERQDLPDAVYIHKLIDAKRLTIKNPLPDRVSAFQKKWGLGRGESAALVLADKTEASLLTDDYAAMRVAKVMGIRFVTTPFLIVQMERIGLINRPLARAKLERLEELAWLSAEVLSAAKQFLEGGTL